MRMTGTLINVGTVVAGTAVGTAFGDRLPARVQQRVLVGLALVTLVLGIDDALAWRHTNPVYVLGAVVLGGVVGELVDIDGRIERLGAWVRDRARGRAGPTVAEGFVTASLLFCVGPLTVLGSIQDGLTGDYHTLATKAALDGFAAVALASALGPGVGLAAITVLVYQGALTLAAGLFDTVLAPHSEALAALTSAGGILIIGIAVELAGLRRMRVANFLPALVFAPAIVGIVGAV